MLNGDVIRLDGAIRMAPKEDWSPDIGGKEWGVSMAEPLLFAKRDGIATLTLNRPDVGNAINTALIEALAQASAQCERDASIRCVVLTSPGRMFCVGGVIGVMETARGNGGGRTEGRRG